MMKIHHFRATIAVLSAALLAGGCATTPAVSAPSTNSIPGVTSIVLVPPVIEYIDANTGNFLPHNDTVDNAVQSAVVSGFRSELTARHVTVQELNEIPNVDAKTLSADLSDTYKKIKKQSSILTPSQQEQLSWLGTMTHASHLMFTRCRLHSGPGGYWNPSTGQIASDSSRVVLECHLYDIQNNKAVWTRAAQVSATSSEAGSSIPTLLSSIFNQVEFK